MGLSAEEGCEAVAEREGIKGEGLAFYLGDTASSPGPCRELGAGGCLVGQRGMGVARQGPEQRGGSRGSPGRGLQAPASRGGHPKVTLACGSGLKRLPAMTTANQQPL